MFLLNSWSVEWIIKALQTITPKHRNFRQITIHLPYCLVLLGVGANVSQTVEEADIRQWSDLDRFLVQLWETRSIRPKAEWVMELGTYMRDLVGCLMPEITKRGIIDLIECP